jgi:hypothetical protein
LVHWQLSFCFSQPTFWPNPRPSALLTAEAERLSFCTDMCAVLPPQRCLPAPVECEARLVSARVRVAAPRGSRESPLAHQLERYAAAGSLRMHAATLRGLQVPLAAGCPRPTWSQGRRTREPRHRGLLRRRRLKILLLGLLLGSLPVFTIAAVRHQLSLPAFFFAVPEVL